MKNRPPKLAQRLFSWYCKNQLHDSIIGDINEQFHQNQLKYGTTRARLIYWIVVFQFINRFTLKKDQNTETYYSISLIKNNFIASLRFLGRNKGFAFLNILGLTVGFTCFLFILLFVNHEYSFDQFHSNESQVTRINFAFQDNEGNVTKLVNSPPALATGLGNKFPEIQKISRLRYTMNCMLSNENIRFYEDRGYYADSLFLETLQFKISSGDPNTALDNPNSIVITEQLAHKYFNTLDAVGATLLLNNSIPLTVSGILSPIPENSHLDFDFLISFSTYKVPEGYSSDLTSWSWLGFLTYVELSPNSDPKVFQDKLRQHFKDLNPENRNPMVPIVQKLSDIYLGSTGMEDDLVSNIRSGNQFHVDILTIVALLILIIAGFNFANLSNAISLNRSKNSGIRKVLGANRRSIVILLLTESLMLIAFCIILSIGITLLLFPFGSNLMGWHFNLNWQNVLPLILLLVISGALVGFLSSIYPATILSGFDVIKSLKGSLGPTSRNRFQLKNILVMLQFAISIGFISATIVMTQQINFLTNKETGYSSSNTILIKMLPEDLSRNYDTYKEQLVKTTMVSSVSRSERIVGDPWPWSIIREAGTDPGNSKRVFFNLSDYDYFETMGIPVISGRAFSKAYSSDPTKSIIINQKAVEFLEIKDPIGKQVHFFELDGPRTIVGVVEDFNYTSLHQEIGPAVMILPFIDLEYMYVRFTPGNLQTQIEFLESTWREIAPGSPLAWQFLDDNLMNMYIKEEKLSLMIQVFSVIAIILACLGLYGIVAFMVNNRIKEFGIRKVLGASVESLYKLLANKYIYQTFLAMVIVLPLIHYLLNKWLENFAYHIKISWFTYPVATLTMIFLIMITISFQTLKAARANPAQLLRDE